MSKFGATGDFPRGKFNDDDEGELCLGIGVEDKTLIINFGKSVAWLGFAKQDAINFATMILEKAKAMP